MAFHIHRHSASALLTDTYDFGFFILLCNGCWCFMQLWWFFLYALVLLATFKALSKSDILSFSLSDLFSSVRSSCEDHALQNQELRRLLQALFQKAVCCSLQSKAVATFEELHIMQSVLRAL